MLILNSICLIKIHWLKDGVRIDPEADANFHVGEEGLFIEYVRVTDEGQYTCVAENEAGSRASQPIQFTVLGMSSKCIVL